MAGSTAEVARVVGEEIARSGAQVHIVPIEPVGSIEAYDAVVVGGPMLMGWHRAALGFLKQHRADFQRIPLAVFVMAMSLTWTPETSVGGVRIFVDQNLPKSPQTEANLSFRERYARAANYVQPILAAIRPAKPVEIALLGGRLEYGRLKWWAVLFAMFIIQAPAGDRRNWPAIRSWVAAFSATFERQLEKDDRLARVA